MFVISVPIQMKTIGIVFVIVKQKNNLATIFLDLLFNSIIFS